MLYVLVLNVIIGNRQRDQNMGWTVTSKRAAYSRLYSQLDREHIPVVNFTLDGERHSARVYERERSKCSNYGELLRANMWVIFIVFWNRQSAGIASGLEYLHSRNVIHADLKCVSGYGLVQTSAQRQLSRTTFCYLLPCNLF